MDLSTVLEPTQTGSFVLGANNSVELCFVLGLKPLTLWTCLFCEKFLQEKTLINLMLLMVTDSWVHLSTPTIRSLFSSFRKLT